MRELKRKHYLNDVAKAPFKSQSANVFVMFDIGVDRGSVVEIDKFGSFKEPFAIGATEGPRTQIYD